MELKNKIIVITGASRGLGKILAELLNKQGSKLILSARSKKELKKNSQKIGADFFVVDITKEKQVMKLAKFAIKKFGRIDVWINNAGIWAPRAPVEKMEMKRIRGMMEVNLFGTIYGSKAALIQMKKQHSGVIINILSTSALEGRTGSAGYCASKYGVAGFTKSIRLETKTLGIMVLSVYPGGMKTNFFDENKPSNFDNFMDPNFVAQKIIENLKKEDPEEELIIKRSK